MKTQLKKAAANAALLICSLLVAAVLCEFAARLAFDRVDVLSPKMVRDPVLGIKLPPGSGGHDQWGFRNPTVPDQADVVAIGDSHTYGNCAQMKEAWPHVIAQTSNQIVYNLGMGGYGPVQYYHLFREYAQRLKPKYVICGLYLGDDFDNAYRMAYGMDHWRGLRTNDVGTTNADIWESAPPSDLPVQKRIRVWLSENSVMYKLVVHGLLQRIKGSVQIANASKIYPDTSTLVIPEKNIEEAFRPKGLLSGLNQESITVKEGMRITTDLLNRINQSCTSNSIKFLVVVIPTKESVFAEHLNAHPDVPMKDVIDDLIKNESAARERLLAQLEKFNIEYIDVLPPLKTAATNRIYTFAATDMHPNKSGYKVIADSISARLQTNAATISPSR